MDDREIESEISDRNGAIARDYARTLARDLLKREWMQKLRSGGRGALRWSLPNIGRWFTNEGELPDVTELDSSESPETRIREEPKKGNLET